MITLKDKMGNQSPDESLISWVCKEIILSITNTYLKKKEKDVVPPRYDVDYFLIGLRLKSLVL